ncbi:MAG: hypothetical protein K2N51_18005 [Lachnospiraceae bacterium]|nr:hypothetical protein [Lachnospiraceae bacterium]
MKDEKKSNEYNTNFMSITNTIVKLTLTVLGITVGFTLYEKNNNNTTINNYYTTEETMTPETVPPIECTPSLLTEDNKENITYNNYTTINYIEPSPKYSEDKTIKPTPAITISSKNGTKTENDESNDNKTTQSEENDDKTGDGTNNTNNSENDNKEYSVEVESNSQMVLMSNGSYTENGDVNITYTPTKDTGTEVANDNHDILSCNLSDILNSDYSLRLKYINVAPGIYTFNFVDCEFDNINVYLTQDINQFGINSQFNEDEEDKETLQENMVIPSQDFFTVAIQESASTTSIRLTPEASFNPIIRFYSENNIDGTLSIFDEDGNELQVIELNSNSITVDSFIQEVQGNFEFEVGKQYYAEITSAQYEYLDEYIYHLQILDSNII